jgi:hypothetical protein
MKMKMEKAYKEGKCVNEDGGWKMGIDNNVDYNWKDGLKVRWKWKKMRIQRIEEGSNNEMKAGGQTLHMLRL